MHNALLHNPPVPVESTREAADFMIGGSLTRWSRLWSKPEAAFFGAGFSSGSLYHETYVHTGVRRVPLCAIPFLRISAMARYSRLWSGAGFREVAAQSYLAQASISLRNYSQSILPDWELEFGVTIDSGLFVDARSNSIEKMFATVALRFPYGRLELWNDAINAQDKGPTYGATLMLDLLRLTWHL